MPAGRLSELFWSQVRGEFCLDPARIHLANFFLASPPASVRAAAQLWRDRLYRDPHLVESYLLGTLQDLGADIPADSPYLQAKTAMAGYLGAPVEEVALVPNTTTGLALVYNGLTLPAGSEILLVGDPHYAHHESARRAAEKAGANVRVSTPGDDGVQPSADEIVHRVRNAIGPRTRCLGLTWVSSRTGVKYPVREIAQLVDDVNRARDLGDRLILVVDGVHGFGVENTDAATLGADFFIAGAHKWFLGPPGTGVLHGRPDAWSHLAPTVPSFEIDATLHACWLQGTQLPSTRASYVAPGGFTDYANIFALEEACRFHERMGRSVITARIHELNSRLRHGLAENPNAQVLTPWEQSMASGFVCFRPLRHTPKHVVDNLAAQGIVAATSPYDHQTVRLAAGINNTLDEVDLALKAVHNVI
ncbi:aminotransferase class V-fold PLP-dependent enzyme [Amycolatopsis sp. NBC_00345]|uniref:aminotransferase class V-fold PLP-dependent enzyme n=1 Tax=Amycolatopsis sp. NBC_00345 TaxID=2975955 RepID=UPI002E263273